jgi:serralysin
MPTVSLNPYAAGSKITRDNLSWSTSLGTPVTVTFGFRESAPPYNNPAHNEQGTFTKVGPAEIAAASLALALWSDVSGISFTRVGTGFTGASAFTDHATMLFGNYSSATDAAGAFAYQPTEFNSPSETADADAQGDVWINVYYPANAAPAQGAYEFTTYIHEIGHAIGLEHPGNYNAAPGVTITYAANAEYIEDTRQYTVMSYFDAINTGATHTYNGTTYYAVTPLLADITAIQRLYGYNANTRTGNTSYGFNSNADRDAYKLNSPTDQKVFAIWDAGGNDTLNASGYGTNQILDLRPGQFSSLGNLTKNVAMAVAPVGAPAGFDYFIENAFGGSGNDSITGNLRDNRLEGRAGNDTLIGGDGNDSLYGGPGIDDMFGGPGSDNFYIDNPADAVHENVVFSGVNSVFTRVSYTLAAAANIRYLLASDPFATTAINLTGNQIVNEIRGNDGPDFLDGQGGADVLVGYKGDDTYFVDNAQDKVTEAPGEGNDGVLTTVSYKLATGSEVEMLAAQDGAGFNVLKLEGNKFNNTIAGDAGPNDLHGAGGNDHLVGLRGNDSLFGDTGSDTAVYSNTPVNFFSGGTPNYCIIHNGDGTITIEHEEGSGIDGTDTLTSVEFANFNGTLLDLRKISVVCGSSAGEYINGYYNVDDNLHGGGGDDIMQGDVLLEQGVTISGAGNDALFGEDGNDNIQDGFGRDTLLGGLGDDYLSGGLDGAPDSLNGGDGNDTVVDNANLVNGVSVVSPDKIHGGAGNDAIATFNTVGYIAYGDGGNDNLYGYWYGSSITSAYSGNDTLYGGSGDDLLVGATGADQLYGGTGDDVINISVLNAMGTDGDLLDGGAGNDRLFSYDSGAPDSMDGGTGNADYAYIDRQSRTDNYVLSLANPAIGQTLMGGTFIVGVERLEFYGGSGNDRITGGALSDTIGGYEGNNTLDGGGGADVLFGGTGNDLYYVDNANDTVAEQSFGFGGEDTVYAFASYQLEAQAEIEVFAAADPAGTKPINLTGSEFNQLIVGNAADNRLDSGYGSTADTLRGLGGNDTYYVWSDHDVVREASGGGTDQVVVALGGLSYALAAGREIEILSFASYANYYPGDLTGNEFDNTILGNDAENRLEGRDGNDAIQGNWGNDTLVGGAGGDDLTGGFGADAFVFNTVSDSPNTSTHDTVNGFNGLEGDKIGLSAIDANTLTAGDGAFSFIAAQAFTKHAGELRLANGELQGDVNGDGKADLLIELSGVVWLLPQDILL